MEQIESPSGGKGLWYAVHCKPLKEREAAAALENYLGLGIYLPEIRRRFRGKISHAPFFPRYLFVQADLQTVAASRINAAQGVVHLVAFDELPQPIPAEVIDAIRERLAHLNAQGGLAEHNFRPGDRVRLKDGPFRGIEAIFAGPMTPSTRVRILLEFLGQLRQTEVDVDSLEHLQTEPAPKRERRTRGKGRRIRLP